MVYWHMPWFMISKKKMGSSKDHFLTSGYGYLEDKNIFVNIPAKTKIFSKIYEGMTPGTRY